MPEAVHPALRRAGARVGTVIGGKYRIERILGAGGMATVYAAEHRNGHRVAVKMLHPELSLRGDVSARFLREGYVANRVRHPGAVQVLDDDVTEDGAAFLVMELLEGETLRALCARSGGRLPCRDVLALGRQLLDVLEAAHGAGIVHRDIKPDNLFLTTEGALKVLDFGIARLEDDSALTTVTGTRLGTPAFMPPELALGRTAEVDARTDLWSVGATMFQLLSGHIVHDAPAAAEIMVRSATVPARSLAAAAPDAPEPVVALVDHALAFEREARWPTAHAMAEAVDAAHAALYGEPVSASSLSVVPRAMPTRGEWRTTAVDAEAETVDAVASGLLGAPPQTLGSTTTSPAEKRTEQGVESAPGAGAAGRAPGTTGTPAAPRRLSLGIAALVAVAAGAAGSVALFRSARGKSPAPAVAAPSPCPAKMVLIPGGSFEMGDAEGRPDEQPVHRVEVASFCLDIDEVTVGAYAACTNARACSSIPVTIERPDLADADRLAESAACNGNHGNRLLHPANCVDHPAATRYCASRGLRLPTEEEWEYAARGGAEQRRYPWGDSEPDPTRLNACDDSCLSFFTGIGHPWGQMFEARDGFPQSAPEGSFRAGDSRWGVHDMAGNVLEWTSSGFCPYPSHRCESPQRIYRGGGWAAVLKTTVQTTRRAWALPTTREIDLGFRCAGSAVP